jgi:hypothetical protein
MTGIGPSGRERPGAPASARQATAKNGDTEQDIDIYKVFNIPGPAPGQRDRCRAALSAACTKINRLEGGLADALRRIAELEEGRTSLEDRLAESRTDNDELTKKFEEANGDRAQLEAGITHAEERLAEHDEEIDDLGRDFEAFVVDLHYLFHIPFLPIAMQFDLEALCLSLGIRRPW